MGLTHNIRFVWQNQWTQTRLNFSYFFNSILVCISAPPQRSIWVRRTLVWLSSALDFRFLCHTFPFCVQHRRHWSHARIPRAFRPTSRSCQHREKSIRNALSSPCGSVHRRAAHSLGCCDEELRSVWVGSRVRHGQWTKIAMFQNEIFVGKLFTIDRFAAGSIVVGEISALTHLRNSQKSKSINYPGRRLHQYNIETHKIGYDAMEWAPFVAETLLVCAQAAKVFGGFRYDVGSQQNDNASCIGWTDSNIEINLWIAFRFVWCRSGWFDSRTRHCCRLRWTFCLFAVRLAITICRSFSFGLFVVLQSRSGMLLQPIVISPDWTIATLFDSLRFGHVHSNCSAKQFGIILNGWKSLLRSAQWIVVITIVERNSPCYRSRRRHLRPSRTRRMQSHDAAVTRNRRAFECRQYRQTEWRHRWSISRSLRRPVRQRKLYVYLLSSFERFNSSGTTAWLGLCHWHIANYQHINTTQSMRAFNVPDWRLDECISRRMTSVTARWQFLTIFFLPSVSHLFSLDDGSKHIKPIFDTTHSN